LKAQIKTSRNERGEICDQGLSFLGGLDMPYAAVSSTNTAGLHFKCTFFLDVLCKKEDHLIHGWSSSMLGPLGVED